MLRNTLFAVIVCLLVVPSAFGQQWAKKMFKEFSHDFGTVAKDAKIEHEFVLKNIYLEDVHITGVRSSCGCTIPTIKNDLLKTYEKGAIVAKFNTRSFRGNRGATLTVTFDKPFYGQVQLHVKGNIRSDVSINPGSVQLGPVDHGETVARKVSIKYYGGSSWKIVGVKSANPHITAEVVEASRRRGQVRYDLLVRLDREAPVGYIKDHLMLVTNDSRSSRIPVLVEGRVEAAVTISPASLFMGVVEPGKRVTKKLVVKGKKPFRILSIRCDDESFEFGPVDNQVAKLVHLVPVTFVAGENAGKVNQTIRIETDLGNAMPEMAAFAVVSAP